MMKHQPQYKAMAKRLIEKTNGMSVEQEEIFIAIFLEAIVSQYYIEGMQDILDRNKEGEL
jgi:hypothetical protein